jgi:hypothetical protein
MQEDSVETVSTTTSTSSTTTTSTTTTTTNNPLISINGVLQFPEVKWDEKTVLKLVTTIKAHGLDSKRGGVDLVVVCDRSWSMTGPSMDMLRVVLKELCNHLSSNDRISIVTFNDNATVECGLKHVNSTTKPILDLAIDEIMPDSGTCIWSGVSAALGVLNQRKTKNSMCAILVLTDGQDGSAVPFAQEFWEAESVGLDCAMHIYGLGNDHNAEMCADLAKIGNGGFHYIKDTQCMAPAFATLWGGLTSTIGQDIIVKISPVAGNTVEVIKAYDPAAKVNTTDYSATLVVPNIFADEQRDFLFDVLVKAVEKDSATSDPVLQLTTTYCAAPDFNKEHRVEVAATVSLVRPFKVVDNKPSVLVDINVHRTAAAEATQTAITLSKDGKYEDARACLAKVIDSILASPHIQVGAHSAILNAIVSDLKMCQSHLTPEGYSRGGQATLTCCSQQIQTQRASMYGSAAGMLYSTPSQVHTQKQFTSQ